jgi:general secretion pathway protein J
MRLRRSRVPARGFTLIEVVVAVTILAVLMTVVYGGLSVALTMWETASRRTEAFEETQTALTVLRAQLRGALPLSYSFEGPQGFPISQLAFEGDSRRARFVSSASWRDGENGVPRWIEFQSGDGKLKVIERAILSPSNEPAAQALWNSELTLLEDVQFRYLRRALADRPAEWRTSWDIAELRELPAAMEVRYKTRGQPAKLTIPFDYAAANWMGYQVR